VPLPQPTRRFGFRPELQKNFIDIDFRSRPGAKPQSGSSVMRFASTR
jgi:hypothetical protein